MKIPGMLRVLAATLLLAWAGAAVAVDTEREFDDPVLQARYEHVSRELRCLVCQNQTIADSDAMLAKDLRREVREMISAGKTDAEIREFMLARYGDFVLYRPRVTAVTFLLWAGPVIMLLLGAFAVIRYIRKQAAEAEADDSGPEAGES